MRKNDHTHLLRMCLICASLLLPLVLSGQEPADTIGGKTHAIPNVTVKGRRPANKVASTSAVQVIGKEEIRNLGLQDMADAVRRFAGTNVRDYGGIGGLKTVSVRNLGAAHTAVSYDGVAVSNCQAGQIDIGRFSLDNVSTLSLAVGQDDNLLQPARLYASAGVLHIETERPRLDEGKKSASRLLMRGGSFGYVAPSLRHWQRLGPQTTLGAEASFLRADGNYPFTLTNGKYVTTEKRNNSATHSTQAEANLAHTFADGSELDAKANYYAARRELPGPVILYNPTADERLWDENFFVQARYRRTTAGRWTLQTQAKYNYAWNKYEDKDVKYETGKQTDLNRQNEYYLAATVGYRANSNLQFALAQDGIVNTLRTNVDNRPDPVRYTSLTALHARFHAGRFRLLGTLVGTYATEHVKNGRRPDDRRRVSPALSASFRPWAGETLYVRLFYKNTFRIPTFNDMYYVQVGNTGLRPEKATEYGAGATWSTTAGAIDRLTVTADGYYNTVDDKIVATPTTYVWKMQNYGKVRIAGIDLTAAASAPLGTPRFRLGLSANYSWQKAIDVTNPDAKNYRHQLPYTPRHSGNAALSLETPWLNASYTVNGVSERYYLPQNIDVNRIDGYAEHNVALWRSLRLGATRLRLQAEVVNLTDKAYDIIKFYPMPGRSWRLTATLDL